MKWEIVKDIIIKSIIMLLLIYVIINQIKIIKMVHDKEDILNADPLVYGAKKYGIKSCTCYINDKTDIIFNMNESKYLIKNNVEVFQDIPDNIKLIN